MSSFVYVRGGEGRKEGRKEGEKEKRNFSDNELLWLQQREFGYYTHIYIEKVQNIKFKLKCFKITKK